MWFLLLTKIVLLWWSVWTHIESSFFITLYREIIKEVFCKKFLQMQRNGKMKGADPNRGGEEPCHCKARATLVPCKVWKTEVSTTSWDSSEIFLSLAVTRDYPMSLVIQSHLWSLGRRGADPVSRSSSQGWEWIQVQLLGRWEFETWSKSYIRTSCLWFPGFWFNPTGPSLAKCFMQLSLIEISGLIKEERVVLLARAGSCKIKL